MTKLAFLDELEKRLSQLPQEEIDKHLSYYAEMIDDMTEDGMEEAAAVEKLGPVSELAAQILKETPLSTLMKTRARPREGWSTQSIVLAVVLSPIWVPLLGVFFALIGAAYVLLWGAVLLLFGLVIGAGCTGIGLLISSTVSAGGTGDALLFVGTGLLLAAAAIPGWIGAVAFAKWIARLSVSLAQWVKSFFIREEAA